MNKMFSSGLAMLALVISPANGLKATTTHYYDGQKGACGCGPADGYSMFPWQAGISPGVYTAAGSQALYDPSGGSWCGPGCGKCYQLTSTGSSPCGQDCGAGGDAGQSIIVMVTNLCPNNGNEQWCPPVGGTNQYGYGYHFDLLSNTPLIGDNVVVDFEEVACPAQAASDYGQCQCPLTGGSTVPPASPPPSPPSPPPVSPVSPPPSGPSATQYGQCGGSSWTGPTECVAGTTCQVQNQYYSQCL